MNANKTPPYFFSPSDRYNRFLPVLVSCERRGIYSSGVTLNISGEALPEGGLLPTDGLEIDLGAEC